MAVNPFIKFPDITGESKQKTGWIDIMSFSWGAAHHVSEAYGGSHSGGKTSISDLTIMKPLDGTSKDLLKACTTGQVFDKILLTYDKATGHGGQQDYFTIEMQSALISGIQWGGGGGDNPTESISFQFQKVTFSYSPEKGDGTLDGAKSVTFDTATQKAS
jgi:type VI secretion system secreted protein Hcp